MIEQEEEMNSKERRARKVAKLLEKEKKEPLTVKWDSTEEELEELKKSKKPFIAVQWQS